MEAKKKAQNLIGKFYDGLDDVLEPYPIEYIKAAKDCALIAVDEIINLLAIEPPRPSNIYQTPKYWLQVKEEIDEF